MAIRKSNPFISIANSYVVDAPEPSNISYFWNFGSLLGTCLVIQLATGIFLAMHYSSNLDLAFNSVQHIMIEFAVSPCIKSTLSEVSNILTWNTVSILATKFNAYISNKYIGWIDKWKDSSQFYLLRIVTWVCGIIYGDVKKFVTIIGNNVSHLIKSNRDRKLNYGIVFIDVDRYNDWSSPIPSWISSIIIIIIIIIILSQTPKDKLTLNINTEGIRDVTAELNVKNLMRTRNYYSTDTSSKSDVITLDHPNENQGKSNSKDRISKVSNEKLLVETYKKLNKYKSIEGKFYNLNKIIGDPFFLIACYENIKSKPGNMTKGSDNKTLDRINIKWFERIAKELVNGTYQFTPARLLKIPKAHDKMRILTITSPRDKIVQKAISIILEAIWEPIFSDLSHGFRPNRSTHSALSEIKLKGYAFPWVVQGDITKCFDSIPHNIIRKEINKLIICPNFKAMIDKVISYKYYDEKGLIHKSKIGTPQGTICSPILANIVLDQLDKYMENYIKQFNKGFRAKRNKPYNKLQYALSRAIKSDTSNITEIKKIRSEMRKIPSGDPMDPNFKRLMFIRYADDFIVLIKGSYQDCITIKNDISNFLITECGLNLNDEKTFISETRKHFKFLGAEIVNPQSRQYIVKKGFGSLKKVAVLRSYVKAPILQLIEKLIKLGLAKRNNLGKIYPKGRTNLFNASHYDIVQWYNYKIQGILSYYSFATNYPKIQYIIWLLHASCALTLTNKHKWNSMRSSFRKFGRYLTDPDTGVYLKIPKNYKVKNQFKKSSGLTVDKFENIMNSSWATKITETNFGKSCVICDTTNNIEMHHIRKIANIRAKMLNNNHSSSMIISAMNRKQVPLCHYHHNLLHNGKLSIWEWKKIKDYKN